MGKRIPCAAPTTQNRNVVEKVAKAFFREALFHFPDRSVLDYSFFEGDAAAYGEPPEQPAAQFHDLRPLSCAESPTQREQPCGRIAG
jgi:hypothetical protein